MDGLKAKTDLVYTSHFIPLKLAVKLGGAGSLQERKEAVSGRVGLDFVIQSHRPHLTLEE